jgi:hypothetical protein
MKQNKSLILLITVILFLCANTILFAQTGALKDNLLKLKTASDSSIHNRPVEKLYLQFDKPYYASGDTIWFKAYLLNSYLTASDKSGIINIDIANDSNKVIKQYRLPVQSGLAWGNISLDEKEGFTNGTYTIRAYTNWMRNFDEGYFFYKSFYIATVNESNWLVNKQVKESIVNGINTADIKLQFSDMNKKPVIVEPLTLQVMNGRKNLYKQKVRTDLSGLVDVNFAIPQKAGSLVIVAESEKKDKRAVIPIALNRAEYTDIQFLPEGGNLVAGLPAHIGFKAIGEDGRGVQISGIITDNEQKQVAAFQSLYNGIGSFDLAIQGRESYSAKVTLPGGTIKDYSLPVIENSGTVLQIKNTMESDSLEVSVLATNDLAQTGNNYFLIAKAREIVCYAAIFNFNNGNFIKRKIAKSLFPTGITHFSITTTKNQPLNERLVFIDHHDNLDIKFITNKTGYHSRDSVALKIKVTDTNGNPVSGNFSLAVTDDAQVKTDTLNIENIITRMLLTSDLKGYVEEPGYYLSSKTIETWQALDNLLLTQGWIGYDWSQVFNRDAITYQAELELGVKGHAINVFNKPVKGTDVLLFSKSPAILMDTTTDKDGKFVFDHFPKVDTPVFVLKAVNKNGKSFNVGITVDGVKAPDFIKPISPLGMPWYVNSDSTLLNYTKNYALIKQQENFPAGGHILKEVKIKAKKIVHGSQNLNGPGEADLVLDEKDMEKAGKKTWLQMLKENIKGFRTADASGAGWLFIQDKRGPIIIDPGMVVSGTHEWYFINDKAIKFYVDGISITDIYPASQFLSYAQPFIEMTDFLNSHSAEDIKGIEVNFSDKYTGTYFTTHVGEYIRGLSPSDFAFIEITTRGGHGPGIDNTPGMFLYKPLPISWPKQFYKPKYAMKDTAKHLPDLRSTIDWEPNITTGINGEAKLWFYTTDKPSTYTLTIEGADMNGNLGYKLGKIKVGE